MNVVLASDLDGTLVRHDIVDSNNVESLNKLKSLGGMFIIATGRPYNGVYPLVNKYNLEVDYNILLNGALIIDKDKNIIVHKTIPFDVVFNISKFVMDLNPKLSFETGFKTYTLDSVHCNLPYDDKEIIFDINNISNDDISLVSMYFEDLSLEKIDDICRTINDLFGEYCVAYRNTSYIDVVPCGCSKGSAIEYVCSSMNIDYDNLYTIGDSFNDVSMFDITNNSFTFYDCENELKNYVSNVVSSVSQCIDDYIIG